MPVFHPNSAPTCPVAPDIFRKHTSFLLRNFFFCTYSRQIDGRFSSDWSMH
jgi:hypothetical protein